ncbi:MAG TPA: autotransporter domain-containing protein [Pseudochrobactrum sp.]|nr:autotransporter domain-containing protein [Pseudochrobactrum sp.]
MTTRFIAMLAVTTCLSTGLLCTSMTSPAAAITPYEIKSADDTPFITLRIFDTGDGVYGDNEQSTWNLADWQINQIIAATQYWSEIISVVPGKNPAVLNVGTFDEVSAAALSWNATAQPGSPSTVQAALTNQPFDNLQAGAHGYIIVGTLNWAQQPYTPSHMALTGETSLSAVLIHEIAHALGVAANAYVTGVDDEGAPILAFANGFNSWSAHLRDDNDKAATPDQIILCNICVVPPEKQGLDTFDVRNDQAYFTGTHVSQALNGAMKGLPMRVATDYGPIDSPVFSHIELKNSLMSHQYYRNYSTLMEAEIAALQDIGYTIDRRNFYGNSVYGDGLTLINDNPFYARNASGTAYLANTYNSATLGLGLHVYGSNNTISQRADLLSAGAGGGGIRVDGAANNLTILPGTRVYADGADGRAVMFAYGKDHTFTHRGDAQALGDRGIAVSFDFGYNSRGDATGYRGSYILYAPNSTPEEYAATLPELEGALVSTFDLTGRVAGRQAAIFMSENALVGRINVMQGANITGDIISNYEEEDENGDLRLTNLSFGLKADREGRSTGNADADFRLTYNGNMTGSNLALQIDGGIAQFSGNHDLFNVAVAQGATLAGQGLYQIDTAQQFRNAGVVNPSVAGTAITINGDYVQADSGTLQLAFNDQKALSQLIVHGQATLDGTLAFAPVKGWYQNGFSVTSDAWLSADTMSGAFEAISTSLASPTLSAAATDNGSNSYTVSLSRADGAYSRYAGSTNGLGAGLALDAAANTASSGLQGLIASLDFSAPDGSALRAALPQLSAESYASTAGVLANAGGATRSAVNNRLQQAFGGTPAAPVSVMNFAPAEQPKAAASAINAVAQEAISKDDLARYTAWGSAFGSWASQSGDGNAARTKSTLGGFTTGIDAAVYDNWRFGVMAGYSRSTFKTGERGSSGSSDNYTLGAYGGTEWATAGGAIGLRSGIAYAWHNVEMSRSVAFSDFSDKLTADYRAGTFQVFGELGYKLNISPRSLIEPYANLAYVHVRTGDFDEKGLNGAALSVHSGSMDTTLSTLGMRVSTGFDLGGYMTTARADLGWRHAYGDVIPATTASFVGGSNAFTSLGTSIGRDTALIETGFDVQLNQNTMLGLSYQGQFGSGLTQNSVNANLSVKF